MATADASFNSRLRKICNDARKGINEPEKISTDELRKIFLRNETNETVNDARKGINDGTKL